MQYVGITETYEPSEDLSWSKHLYLINIIITKNLTDELIQLLKRYEIYTKCILHISVTGMGQTIIEPNVPPIEWTVNQLRKLLNSGSLIDKPFPIEQIVLRISPVVPTNKGLETLIKVLDAFKEFNIKRIRFSTLNMYKHVKERFDNAGLEYPYGTYSCPQIMRFNMIKVIQEYYNVGTRNVWTADKCAEVDLDEKLIIERACVSEKDLEILNLQNKIKLIGSGKQRRSCMCPNNKKQILTESVGRCNNKCLYCYWKD